MNTNTIQLRGFLDASTEPMSEEVGQILMSTLFIERDGAEGKMSAEDKSSFEGCFIYQVLVKRLEAYGVECEGFYVPLFLTALIEASGYPTPAHAVMWAYTMYCVYRKNDRKPLTLEEVVMAFPNGFPKEDEYVRKWEEQKGGNYELKHDNLLDSLGWSSLYEGIEISDTNNSEAV